MSEVNRGLVGCIYFYVSPSSSSDALKCEIKEREQVYYAHWQIPQPLNTKYLVMLAPMQVLSLFETFAPVSGQCAAAA